MTDFKELIQNYADGDYTNYSELNTADRLELILAYIDYIYESDCVEFECTLSPACIRSLASNNSIPQEFSETFFEKLEEDFGDAIEDHFDRECEYQRNPGAYQRELISNIHSENLKRTAQQTAWTYGLTREKALA